MYFIRSGSKELNSPTETTMHCEMLKIQDGVTISEKLNCSNCRKQKTLPSTTITTTKNKTINAAA